MTSENMGACVRHQAAGVSDGWKLAVDSVAGYAHLYSSGQGIIHEIRAEHARLLAAAPQPAAHDLGEAQRLREAVAEFFHAKQALADFERDNPGNSTKRWDACLLRVEVAEDAMLDALSASTWQEAAE